MCDRVQCVRSVLPSTREGGGNGCVTVQCVRSVLRVERTEVPVTIKRVAVFSMESKLSCNIGGMGMQVADNIKLTFAMNV